MPDNSVFYCPPEEPERTPAPWPDMAEEEYRQHPATSHSDIRHWIKPKKLGRVGVIGSATHTIALEGMDVFNARFVCADCDFDLRGREGKERAAKLVGDTGKELLRPKEMTLVERMVAALRYDPTAKKILEAAGRNEVSLVGKFEGFEQDYKALLDMVREKSIWDLKTTSHINEAMWLDSEVDYGYINQAEWYASLYAALTGTYKPFGFLCVSKREPHNVWIRLVPNHLMAMGRQWRQDVLTLYERYVPKEMRDAKR